MSDVLYLSIVSSIKEKILKGDLKPGEKLESEPQLMKIYDAGRMTIRKSLSLLSNEGYVYSVPGKGNYICKPDTDIFQFKFNKYDGLKTHIDKVKLLSVTIKDTPKGIEKKLNLEENDKIVEVVRLLSSKEQPIALEYVYFEYLPNQPVIEDMLKFANYLKPLEEKLAFVLDKTLEIGIELPNEELKNKLEFQDNEPLFKIMETIKNTSTKKIVQYTIFYIRPKYLSLKASLPKVDKSSNIF
ncbi:MAG: GntR family transcriptional regulator [Eubacteriaceae bacterium]|jgi:GntR family transcriptional regulator|nr:GntR family transcriptional regulator [Eubacteriaceae bacterium]